MEKHPNNAPMPNEEIDLIVFFKMLGRFFAGIFYGFKAFFKYLFRYIIEKPFELFVRHKKIYLPFLLVLMTIAVILDITKREMYIGEMLLSPNYDSGKELYNTIEYLNNLIATEDYETLGKIFAIEPERAEKLINIEIEPNYNERIDLKYFSQYVKYLDTLVIDNANYEDFQASLKQEEFDYPQHIITLLSEDPEIYPYVNRYFDTLLESKELFIKRRKTFLENQQYKLEQSYKAVAQIDSLRSSIDYAIKNMANGANVATSGIIIGSGKIEFPESKYNLFKIRKDLLGYISMLKKEMIEQEEVLKINAYFPPKGSWYDPFWRRYKVVFLLGFWVLLILVGILWELFGYLQKKTRENITDPSNESH